MGSPLQVIRDVSNVRQGVLLYTTLPSLLFKAQAKLKLSPLQLNVLLQIIEPWFKSCRRRQPSPIAPMPTEQEAREVARRVGRAAVEFAATIVAPLYWVGRNPDGTAHFGVV